MDLYSNLEKDINYFTGERKDLLAILPENISSVLDIGCGCGNLGRLLKGKGINRVVGIEIDDRAAQLAKKNIDEVINTNVESYKFDFRKDSFDLIVFADVLEHLVDPWSVLEKAKKILKKDGYLLISVPNIRYYRVLFGIIFKGEFQYEPHGILDTAHLRFFTLKTLKVYLNQKDLRIVRIKKNFSGYISWFINKLFLDIFSDFFTRQYIILAQSKS